jgi:hypothetical protein
MRGIETFHITENGKAGEITAIIEAGSNHVLIWMNSSNYSNTDYDCTPFNVGQQRSLGQLTAKFRTDPSTSYTICAAIKISEQEIMVPPLNCRAYKTQPRPEDRPLLLNKEKKITLAISCFALLVSVIVSGATIYYVVLRNPTLLKPNKNVVIVPRDTRQIRFSTRESYSQTDTPRISQTSHDTQSTGETSYITVVEPTTVELIASEFKQMCDELSGCKTESTTVIFLKHEPSSLPSHRISDTSNTSSYTVPISENNYVVVIEPTTARLMFIEPTTVRLMAQMFNQLCHELTDNCIPESANESYS